MLNVDSPMEQARSGELCSLAPGRHGGTPAKVSKGLLDTANRFFTRAGDRVAGPFSAADLREQIRARRLSKHGRARLEGSAFWAPVEAWQELAVDGERLKAAPAFRRGGIPSSLPLAGLDERARQRLRFWTHENGRVAGPILGVDLDRRRADHGFAALSVCLVGDTTWRAAVNWLSAPSEDRASGEVIRCPICLESVPSSSELCPECDEPLAAQATPASALRAAPPSASPPGWLKLHWRPLVIVSAVVGLVAFGIALRVLAPSRWSPTQATTLHGTKLPAVCTPACWPDEACQLGECVWQPPKDARHLGAEPTVGGPFSLPKDVSDALPIDSQRFAIALTTGTEIRSTRTGEVQSLVSEAAQTRRLFRVGNAIYASSSQRIHVIDAETTRVLKTIETGSAVGAIAVGGSGQRALASLPAARAVAILATEFNAEIDRIQFGDDAVGPVGVDETGKRALTVTGQIPLPGLRDLPGGVVYAFDPGRLATQQDRVRASVLGNPVSVLMTPDGQASYVVARADSALVPLEWMPSGIVRQKERIMTCKEPEQIELVRKGRRAVVRCNEGRAIEVFDVMTGARLQHVALNARAVDLAVTPDGAQAIVALAEGAGFVAVVDLDTAAVKLLPLNAEPTHVRLAPDGDTAIVFSDRAKVAWVLR